MTIVELFKLLSDANRLRILNLLYANELCVCELEYLLDISQSNLSKHLRLMNDAGILESRRQNKFAYYKIKDEEIKKHEFLKSVFEIELKKEDFLTEELDKLGQYQQSDITCQSITALICEKAKS